MHARLWLGLLAAGLLGGCSGWQRDVTLHGVRFSRVKVEPQGLTIGWLEQATEIGGRPCQRGWVHLHASGAVAAFTNAEPLALGALTIPRGTWVRQDELGTVTVCAFPEAMEVQGHACRGTGGPKGVQTAFYPGGALKSFFPVRDAVVDGVPCRASVFNGWIELHANGRLKSGLLSAELERDGRRLPAGTRVEFDPEGRVRAPR